MTRASGGGGGANNMHPLSFGGGGVQTEKIRARIFEEERRVYYTFVRLYSPGASSMPG